MLLPHGGTGNHQGQPDALAFSAGDLVDVKARSMGRATVLEVAPPGGAADVEAAPHHRHPFAGRVNVRFHEDGTTYWVNPSNLRHMRPACARIVVAYRTELYRAAIIHNVEYCHCCLEVGSHTGTTTAMLHKRCGGRAVGVDNVSQVVQGARERFPGVRFELADGADLAALRALRPGNPQCPSSASSSSPSPNPQPATGSASSCHVTSAEHSTLSGAPCYDVVCVDLSGKAPLHVVVPLLAAYLHEWPAARLIVKNEALFCAVEAWQQQQSGSCSSSTGQKQQQQQGAAGRAAAAGQDGEERLLSDLLAGWQLGSTSSGRSSRGSRGSRGTCRSSVASSHTAPAVVQQLDDASGVGASLTDPAAACQLAASQLAAVLPECELFRSEGFLSQTDKPLNKAKARRCQYCGQGSIGKWKVHNRQCGAKQAAIATKREASSAAAAAEGNGAQPSCLP